MSPDLLDLYDIRTSATEDQWDDFIQLIEKEDWKSNDLSTTALLPTLPSTRLVIAVRKSDDVFVSAVVWNEVDNVAMIGYYLTKEEERGKGIGTLVWRHAMESIDREKRTIVLRTDSKMAAKYQKTDLPVMGKRLFLFNESAEKMVEIFTNWLDKHGIRNDKNNNPGLPTKCVNELSIPEFDTLLDYDQKVTGRDRSDFLDSFFSLEQVKACVTQTPANEVNGFGAVVQTMNTDNHIYKLAPIYASDINMACSIALSLCKKVHEGDTEAKIVIHTMEDSSGANFLHKVLKDMGGLEPVEDGVTLMSRKMSNLLRMHMCFVPHNNCGHFDA